MNLLLAAFTMCCFSASISNGISTGGYYFVSNACYQNSVSLSAAKIEFKGMEVLECGRLCATHESCKACHVFTHSATKEKICYLYTNNLCNTDVIMYQDSVITNGRIWDKISADNTSSISTCRSEADCIILTGNSVTTANPTISFLAVDTTHVNLTTNLSESTASYATTSAAVLTSTSEINTILSNMTSSLVASSSTINSSAPSTPPVQSYTTGSQANTLFSNLTTFNANSSTSPVSSSDTLGPPLQNTMKDGNSTQGNITGVTETSPTTSPMAPASNSSTSPTPTFSGSATVTSTTSSTTAATTTSTSATAASTANLGEPRPRTCWDYYTHNGTNDTDYGTPRTIWPSGYSSGPNISAHCRNGYTVIIINYAQISFTYQSKNDVTVFGSTGRIISTSDIAGWRNYTASINFPVLSDLVRSSSNRTLYYEHTTDGLSGTPASIGVYSGLDIAPDGTLTVQGNLQVVKGSPLNGFYPPLINSPFVNSTCGSFWKIPANSTDICTQNTNMLLLQQYQKVAGNTRRFVCLAFK